MQAIPAITENRMAPLMASLLLHIYFSYPILFYRLSKYSRYIQKSLLQAATFFPGVPDNPVHELYLTAASPLRLAMGPAPYDFMLWRTSVLWTALPILRPLLFLAIR